MALRQTALQAAGERVPSADSVHAVMNEIDGLFQPCGHTFVESGGGGGVFAAARAPCADFVGGAVGDAVAVELLEPVSLTGAAVLSYTFAESFGHWECFSWR